MEFTQKELCMISKGLLCMISNAQEAKSLLYNVELQKGIDADVAEMIALNNKVCERLGDFDRMKK